MKNSHSFYAIGNLYGDKFIALYKETRENGKGHTWGKQGLKIYIF